SSVASRSWSSSSFSKISFSVFDERNEPVAIEMPPVTAAATPVSMTMRRLCVAVEMPLNRPTALSQPSWMPNTHARPRMGPWIFFSFSRGGVPIVVGAGSAPQERLPARLPRPPVGGAQPPRLQRLHDTQRLLHAAAHVEGADDEVGDDALGREDQGRTVGPLLRLVQHPVGPAHLASRVAQQGKGEAPQLLGPSLVALDLLH